MSETEVRLDADAGRYEMTLDGRRVGFVTYRRPGEAVVLEYLEIDPAFEGRGLGGRLAAAVLEDCRARGLKVLPECSFVAAYMRTHPEYADLRAEGP